MKWLEVELMTTSDASEAVSEILMQCAAQGIATQDPHELKRIYEDPDQTIFKDPDYLDELEEQVHIRAYFPVFDDGVAFEPSEVHDGRWVDTAAIYAKEAYPEHRGTYDALRTHLSQRLDQLGAYLPVGEGITALREVAEADWAEQWKAHYHPIRMSPRLTIVPSWERYSATEGERILVLDPGSAFGTGDHPTTALCLALIDQELTEGARVADIGCGSGVLGIGACLLGAGHVDAVDIDPNAITVTQDNARINQVEACLSAQVGELTDLTGTYDLVVANLVAELHVQLADDYRTYLTPGARLIISGIVIHKAQSVRDRFADVGYKMVEERASEDWHAMVFEAV